MRMVLSRPVYCAAFHGVSSPSNTDCWISVQRPPQNWPEERKYNERDLLTAIKTFINERAKSINWLRNLQTPNWENTTEHPVMGPMTATDMFAAWLRHDHLHLRQLNEIMMAWGEKEFEGRRYQYAGE